jgi:translation elongation factor EF-Tu-like GTPase
MAMNKRTLITKTIASASLALALVGGIAGTAGAQTREHILLARQVGVPSATVELRAGSTVKQIAAGNQDTAGRVVVRWEKLSVPFA